MVALVAVLVVYGTGVLTPSSSSQTVAGQVDIGLRPNLPSELKSSDGGDVVNVPAGSVGASSKLTYHPLSSFDPPAFPPSFRATSVGFDLASDTPLLKPIIITAKFSAEDALLAGGDQTNLVMQHHREGAWKQLDTVVDFGASTATVSVDHLSIFALMVKEPPAALDIPKSAAYQKGLIFYKNGQYQLAIDEFNLAIEQDSNISTYYWSRGNAYLSLTDLNQAIDDYTTAIGLDPENATIRHLRGISYRADGRLVEALADFNEAIRLNPEYAVAYNSRGNTYTEVSLKEKAKTDYDKACQLDKQYCK